MPAGGTGPWGEGKGGNVVLEITRFTVEHETGGCITDKDSPRFAFAVRSNRPGAQLERAVLKVGDWEKELTAQDQIGVDYAGDTLTPFTEYEASLAAWDDAGECAAAALRFETGRRDTPWAGVWISDASYIFREKKVSPTPMVFRRRFRVKEHLRRARLCATALGVYEARLNGKKVGNEYLAPGFTSYESYLQYQTHDVTDLLQQGAENELTAEVVGGWAVGSFVFTRKNRISGDRQAFLAELRLEYEDGSREVIGTDSSWEVTEDGPVRMSDLYDGETVDCSWTMEQVRWRAAAQEKLRIHPEIAADIGVPVREKEVMHPVSVSIRPDGEIIYDFGQNFAGIVRLHVKAGNGQTITVRHAEILNRDGSLNTAFLRTAKATATYLGVQGQMTLQPRFTYMGFRYAGVRGIRPEEVEAEGVALYSDIEKTGDFSCSNSMLNQLQSNILWGTRSNFVDIPTDCPQRDERMGWTGDIAVFAPTACSNFNVTRFLEKWLRDVRAEQLPTGGIPNTVPVQGYGFPATMPKMAVDWWGDACVLVPWALYQANGDESLLRTMYGTMKRYVRACRFWAGFGIGKHRYIWHTPSALHFGDWVAPDVTQMSQWQKRSKYTATASLCSTSGILAQTARILGEEKDAAYYEKLRAAAADAYCEILTDGNGKTNEEFQTAYVLPLYLGMFPEKVRQNAADNLDRLVRENEYRVGTGFPGTPYVLFALADNGHEDTAYRMLLNTECPGWLYEVKMGATTVWERWNGLDENGECPIGDDGTDLMISYNHYASGAVGAFLYRRVLGIEAAEPGYRYFTFRPVIGGGLTQARGKLDTPYGAIEAEWSVEEGQLAAKVTVPMGTKCSLELPGAAKRILPCGTYDERVPFPQTA